MDYDSFMICSVTASHFNYQNLKKKKNIDWDESWKLSRSNMDTSALNKNRLSIFSISQILGIPKETVRRKLEKLLKKKILKYSTKAGVIFGEKIDIFKPYAKHEVMMLSTFLKSLNDHGGLEDLLQIKKTDL
jgi:predicted transcriptional regulator